MRKRSFFDIFNTINRIDNIRTRENVFNECMNKNKYNLNYSKLLDIINLKGAFCFTERNKNYIVRVNRKFFLISSFDKI